MRSRTSIFKKFIPLYRISILPNRSNEIHIHTPADKNVSNGGDLRSMENNEGLLNCLMPYSFLSSSCSKMEPKIVKYSLQLLDKKRCDEAEEFEKEELLNRMNRIESMLTELLNNRSAAIN